MSNTIIHHNVDYVNILSLQILTICHVGVTIIKKPTKEDDTVNTKASTMKTTDLTGLAMLTALVVILQLFATFITLPVANPNLTLIPVVIGGAIYGRRAGSWLGFTMAVVILATYLAGSVGLGPVIMTRMPVQTVLITLFRGVMTGLIPATLFKLIKKKDMVVGAFAAALLCPVINTGIYVVGVVWLFKDIYFEIKQITGGNIYWILLTSIAANFTIEFILNTILSPVILTVIKVRSKIQK